MTISALILALPFVGMPSENALIAGHEQGYRPPEAVVQTLSIEPEVATETEPPEDGAIVVTGRGQSERIDPLRALNAESFAIVQSVDGAVTRPVALAYQRTVPAPVRSGLRNFLGNLQEPVVFLNYLLQFKVGKSVETLGRFSINSTIGAAGLFDIAKRRPFNLPHRNNGFAYTLGFYGVKSGPYMYLPLMGPTTLRDLAGRLIDLSVLPFAVGQPLNDPAFVIPTTVLRLVDERAESDETTRKLLDGADDPYSTIRTEYLRLRQAEIDALRGRLPMARQMEDQACFA